MKWMYVLLLSQDKLLMIWIVFAGLYIHMGAKLEAIVRRVIQAIDLALLITEWSINGNEHDGKPINLVGRGTVVLRRQPNGTWLMVIENPWGNRINIVQRNGLQLLYYFTAEILGALLGSLFVMTVFEGEADSPNYVFPLPTIFGIEVLASALLMAVIVVVVYANGLRRYSGLEIGGIVGLDIFFFAFISGASMSPARSLAPALTLNNLWLYWSATFIGTSIIALLTRKKFTCDKFSR
jgi:hypothetical protein